LPAVAQQLRTWASGPIKEQIAKSLRDWQARLDEALDQLDRWWLQREVAERWRLAVKAMYVAVCVTVLALTVFMVFASLPMAKWSRIWQHRLTLSSPSPKQTPKSWKNKSCPAGPLYRRNAN
jgi:hypothetical protein